MNRAPWPVRDRGRLVPPRPGDVLIHASIGPGGELLAAWSGTGDAAALRSTTTAPGWAVFPDPAPPRPVGVVVTRQDREPEVVARIPDLPLAHVTVQLLPSGHVLVVGARCAWRPEGPDRNAIVYDAGGEVVAAATLGDGIEHVLVGGDGDVWVGYFDEGVYGNYGWGGVSGPAPLGSSGLVRFSADLAPVWHYPSHVDDEWGAIDDCYALNVDGDTAWACYYSGFPIVRVRDGEVTGWRNDVGGATALAVSGSRAALYGGYDGDRDRLVTGTLGAGRFTVDREHRVVLPDGRDMPPTAHVVGRGSRLHVVAGDRWYVLDVDDAPPQPG